MHGRDAEREVLVARPVGYKAGVPDHLSELFLLRKPLNALHEVLVRVAVADEDLAHERDAVERVCRVQLGEHRDLDLRELEAREHATGLEHAVGGAQRLRDVGEVADAEAHGVHVLAVVRHIVECLSICDHEVDAVALTRALAILRGFEPLCALGEHLAVDIRDRDLRFEVAVLLSGVLKDSVRDVAGASGDIQEIERSAASAAAWVEPRNEVVLPQTVHAGTHGVVHVVVVRRHVREHRAHELRLVLTRDRTEPEVGRRVAPREPKHIFPPAHRHRLLRDTRHGQRPQG